MFARKSTKSTMIVALMGMDGSGKTSIATSMELKLRKLGVGVGRHLGFEYVLLDLPLQIFGRGLNKAREEFSRGREKSVFLLWPFLVFLDCVITYVYIKLSKRHKIVIFDRYFYDFLMSFEYLGYSNRVIRKLFLSLPRPDMAFILDVSPKVAYERKRATHNYNINFYKAQRKRYLRLAHRLGIMVVNTERMLDEVVDEVLTKF